ncbi:IS21-like element helper ATPase IstB [Streptomyces sp. MNU76]|uniref:IS21-like element helper ATPase IstB n=1 Tax=Streptomyces sp. MNU76 TaxID=2560026 RepID=UPI0027DF9E8A|nr:IS21-like element helper ATPase IstB [Streptomyces sp. MNU76]
MGHGDPHGLHRLGGAPGVHVGADAARGQGARHPPRPVRRRSQAAEGPARARRADGTERADDGRRPRDLPRAAADPGPGDVPRDPLHAGRDAAGAVRDLARAVHGRGRGRRRNGVGAGVAGGAGVGTGVGTGVEGRVRAAGFPARKLLEEFDEGHPRSFDRRLLARLGTLDFLGTGRNVVFVGAPGTGKTHLAIGLGVRACQAGHRVMFATATEWAARLAGARAEGRLAEELSALDACPLLIVDEVGYLPFDTDTARLFFQLIAHRYERASLIVTSDRPLGRWEEIFGGAAPAMVDRLAHHAEIVLLEGDSYRLRTTSAG